MPAMVEYIAKDSFVHRLNPITKIIWTFVVLALSFMFSQPLIILVIFVTNLLVAAVSGVFKQILPIVKGLFIFSLFLVLCQIFFVTDGNTLFYAIPYFNKGRITDTGLILSLTMALRMLSTVSAIPIMIMTTPMTDIVVVMVEKLKVPFKYSFMFITALRFIPTFMGEMEQILQAQMSRGYHSDTRNPFKKLVIVIPLAVPLLVSSVKKTEKMAISMEVRGFGSGKRTHYKEIKMQSMDYFVLVFFTITIISSFILSTMI
ncbi:MAG: energy-coupling factor transporter transmembrane protein EcfT [Clostridia bacterium]|nr:energy-coupling factor transporter transmembrane protein EcfT [Clostridia bacterium]